MWKLIIKAIAINYSSNAVPTIHQLRDSLLWTCFCCYFKSCIKAKGWPATSTKFERSTLKGYAPLTKIKKFYHATQSRLVSFQNNRLRRQRARATQQLESLLNNLLHHIMTLHVLNSSIRVAGLMEKPSNSIGNIMTHATRFWFRYLKFSIQVINELPNELNKAEGIGVLWRKTNEGYLIFFKRSRSFLSFMSSTLETTWEYLPSL